MTYDPKVGFILDPVTEEDSDSYMCTGTKLKNSYNSRFSYHEMGMERDSESIGFTLDVSKYFMSCRYTFQHVLIVNVALAVANVYPACLSMSYS